MAYIVMAYIVMAYVDMVRARAGGGEFVGGSVDVPASDGRAWHECSVSDDERERRLQRV